MPTLNGEGLALPLDFIKSHFIKAQHELEVARSKLELEEIHTSPKITYVTILKGPVPLSASRRPTPLLRPRPFTPLWPAAKRTAH